MKNIVVVDDKDHALKGRYSGYDNEQIGRSGTTVK
jgi:hypothetical protein